MSFDPETIRETVALVSSFIAVASTFYFWLVRANRERAQLTVQAVAPLTGTVLMNEDYETQQRVRAGDGMVCAKYFLSLAVVNNSSLPNALIGVRVWMPFRDGEHSDRVVWTEMDIRHFQPETALFPINLQPLSTSSLSLAMAAAIPGTHDGGFARRALTATEALSMPVPIRVELRGLNHQTFVVEIEDAGLGMAHPKPVACAA